MDEEAAYQSQNRVPLSTIAPSARRNVDLERFPKGHVSLVWIMEILLILQLAHVILLTICKKFHNITCEDGLFLSYLSLIMIRLTLQQ